MAEEIIAPSTPAASPAAEAAPSPVESSAHPVEAAPVEAPPVTETPAAPVEPTTILGAEPAKPETAPEPAKEEPKVEEKPADAPKEEAKADDKPKEEVKEPSKEEEAKKDEAPKEGTPLPTFDAFTLPENTTLNDNEKLGKLTTLLGQIELAKGDHAEVQKFGQELVDMHIAEVQATAQRIQDAYNAAWEKTKSDWKDSFLRDPEIGGNRRETTVSAAVDAIRVYGGTPDQQTEFRNLMEATGLGNHPAVIRLLSNVTQARPEPKTLAAPMPVVKTSKLEKMYGKA